MKEQEQLLEEKYAKSLAAMEPVKKKLEQTIEELKQDISKQDETYAKEDGAVQDYMRKMDEGTKQIASIEKAKLSKRAQYNQAMVTPPSSPADAPYPA